jgi:hypothetical protein
MKKRDAPKIYSLRSIKESLSNAELGMGNAELKRILKSGKGEGIKAFEWGSGNAASGP